MMNTIKASIPRVLSAVIVLAFSASVFSQAHAAGYIGVGAGQSSMSDLDEVCNDLEFVGVQSGVATSCRDDDSDTGFKLFGGWRFNENWAIEGSLFDLGEYSVDLALRAPNGATGQVTSTLDVKGAALAVVGSLPLGERTSLFGKLGVAYGEGDVRTTATVAGVGTVLSESDSESETDALFGAGLDVALTESVSIRFEWERYNFEDEIDFFVFSILFGW